jgi:hypothetical protein
LYDLLKRINKNNCVNAWISRYNVVHLNQQSGKRNKSSKQQHTVKQELSEYAQNLLDRQSFIESNLSEMEAIINKAKRNEYGLTLDADKTAVWQAAKKQYSVYWDAYRRINSELSKIRKAVGYESVNGKRVTIYQYNN